MTGRAAEPTYDAGLWENLARRWSPFLDIAIAIAAAGLSAVALVAADMSALDPRLQPADALSVLATIAAGLALVWRRSRPVASFAVFVAGCLVVSLTGHYIGLLSLLLLFSLYSLAAHGRRRDGVLGLAVSIAVFGALALLDVPDLQTSDLAQAYALLLAAWAVGDAMRSRRRYQGERLRAAHQQAAAAQEHAVLAVVEERLRIARDLHDVVAHHMSLIAVQAGVGAHVIRTDVTAAEQALEIIADTSRRALAQTRSMLGLLREAEAEAESGPQGPSAQAIDDLPALVQDVSAAGVAVALTVTGPGRPLDPGVELTAYRIVQESLTNVLKHSPASTATVRIAYERDGIDVEISDSGAGQRLRVGPRADTGGHGLLGLRERSGLHGGTVEYGACAAGFRVHAFLPSPVTAAP